MDPHLEEWNGLNRDSLAGAQPLAGALPEQEDWEGTLAD